MKLDGDRFVEIFEAVGHFVGLMLLFFVVASILTNLYLYFLGDDPFLIYAVVLFMTFLLLRRPFRRLLIHLHDVWSRPGQREAPRA